MLLVLAAAAGGFVAGRGTAPIAGDLPASVRAGQAALPAPEQLSPPLNETFDHFPRYLTLVWQAVPGATSYVVDVEYSDGGDGSWHSLPGTGAGHVEGVTGTSHSISFVGAQPGRWRVTAVDDSGRPGPPSAWSVFTFTR